jgi:hypothetical protein
VVRFVENSLSSNQLNISRVDIPCILENDVGEAARSMQLITLHITVNITPPHLYKSPPSIPTKDDNSPAEDATIPGRIQFREEMSLTNTKNPRSDLRRADEYMERIAPIGLLNTWERAVGRMKWVMDTLNPIAEVRVMPF